MSITKSKRKITWLMRKPIKKIDMNKILEYRKKINDSQYMEKAINNLAIQEAESLYIRKENIEWF
ncbi:MAG: hypothetical protein KDK54_19750 [Leptospiraceae bacterium]|nr:hypothetical protein [Leptospiraceae bacterium]